ncbi:AraC family transcriptional regulator [Cupriavidus pauculus]|uniref:AraC family transcriptional regulator n=1 Tax=Cupriavidus pauculus TaxID=82633 RepID=A0A3G8H9Q0_9BURK|nr:AraC family transcriptional regulator [Cupriavidus pauculus]AZG17194.1 AraC family transcriptional regulator [Cupriavidus pauculus]
MESTLLSAVRRYADAHSDAAGTALTPVPGLTIIQATSASALHYSISRPLICLVQQGSKRVTVDAQNFDFTAGDSLVISADVPTVSQITGASIAAPYLSLVMELDNLLIAELCQEIGTVGDIDETPVRVDRTDTEVTDAAFRLMRLLDRPAAVPVLRAQIVRELHYWLLMGRYGTAIRKLGKVNSHAQRVARAVAVIRAEFDKPLTVERLAAVAGMSQGAFHQHFRSVTSLTPLQFQKYLRLIEARRLMLSEGVTASRAAFAVGYESVPQFTREYGRMFGQSPARDTRTARSNIKDAA